MVRRPTVWVTESKDWLFRKSLLLLGIGTLLFLLAIFITLMRHSRLAFSTLGLTFFFSTDWDPVQGLFGAFPFVVGTLCSAVLALLICIPFAFSLAIFLGVYFRHGFFAQLLRTTLDLLAGIPSVIYGFWGMVVLVPLIRKFEIMIGVVPYGVGLFTAALILSLMIIPYAASVSRDVMAMFPDELREAALALGCTPFSMIWHVLLPYSRSGVFAGLLMAFGRAISETMAVTMLIGNANVLPTSLFSPANTLSSIIANEFTEASDPLLLSSLIELGLVLLIVTTVFSFIGRLIIRRLVVQPT